MQHFVSLHFLIEDDVKNHQKKVLFEILIFSRFLGHIRIFHSQILHDEKIHVLEVRQRSMRICSMERASKTDQEDGMVCYVLMNISRVTGDQKFKNLLNQQLSGFLITCNSRNIHRNITNHTIFLISF